MTSCSLNLFRSLSCWLGWRPIPLTIAGWTYLKAERAEELEARWIGPYGRNEIGKVTHHGTTG